MDDADARCVYAPIHRLAVADVFRTLADEQKLYAHHMSRAAWYGTRIILRQVSAEALDIFDFILEVHRACSGRWQCLIQECKLSENDLAAFLEYCGTFCSNVGNYYGYGDQKFIPNVSEKVVEQISEISPRALELFKIIRENMFSVPPYSLGFPSESTQSAYYPGSDYLSRQEITQISHILETEHVLPENTRLAKSVTDEITTFRALVASGNKGLPRHLTASNFSAALQVEYGDHSRELDNMCSELSVALQHCANETQKSVLEKYIESFKSGDLEVYRDALKLWVTDVAPHVENIFGFVEPYRDPYGIRAEFEGLVAINDATETARLQTLVDKASIFIKRLPWAIDQSENDGKGPFEKAWFDPPSLTSIHTLAYCSSIIFPGINLPNYNDIRENCGFKNVIIANRMSAESSSRHRSPFVDPLEVETFHAHKFPAYYLWVVLHELLGHGTGKMLCEESDGTYNFEKDSPPVNPLDGHPIKSWYKRGQSWTGQFEDLATTVDECRAELVGAYLMDDKELLEIFGYTESSRVTADDITYNLYVQLGVDGLRGLQNYDLENQRWGQAHSRAHFATLKWLVQDGHDFMSVEVDSLHNEIRVKVDRSRIVSHGKASLGRMLLRLHIYRCTADVAACRSYYEELSSVTGEFIEWRRIVLTKREPKWKFVQANTQYLDGRVVLKEYEATNEGIVQSWAERDC